MIERARADFSVPQAQPLVGGEGQAIQQGLAGLKQATRQVYDVNEEKVRKKQMADDASALIDFENRYRLGIQTVETEAQKDAPESGDGYIKAVQTARAKVRDETLKSLPSFISAEAKAQAQNLAKRYDGDSDRRATDWQDKQSTLFAVSAFEKSLANDVAGVLAAPETAKAARAAAETRLTAISGRLTPDQEEAQRVIIGAQIGTSAIKGLTDANRFEEAKEALKDFTEDLNGEQIRALDDYITQGEARKKRETYEAFSLGITQETVRPADLAEAYAAGEIKDAEYNSLLVQSANQIARKEAERQAAIAKVQEQTFDTLMVGLDDGRYTRADVERLHDTGRITSTQWRMAAVKANEKAGDQTALNGFLEALSIGMPIDPGSSDMKKGADAYFQSLGGKDLFVQDFPAAMDTVQTFARDAGIIPNTAVSVLRGMKSAGTPQQQMYAIEAIGDLYEMQSNATDAAFTEGEVAEAISFRFKLDAGIAPDVAYSAILKEREARNEPPGATSVTKARVADARTLANKFEITDALKPTDRGGFFGLFKTDKVSGGAPAEQQILADYRQAFQTYYVQHGDEELAKKQASATISRTVGVSQANGGRIMLHPPERYYPDTGEKNWMMKTLTQGVADALGTPVNSSQIELVSDIETARAVNDGQPPTYAVKVTTGGVAQILPNRWSFDMEVAQQKAKAKVEADKKKTVSKVRTEKATEAGKKADALGTMHVPTGMMTPDQIKRVEEMQAKARKDADLMAERAEAD